MSDVKQNEPSMEEILASIRRIIAEDGEAPKPDQAAPEDSGGEEVLELTEVIEEPAVDEPAPAAAAPPIPTPAAAPAPIAVEPEPEPDPLPPLPQPPPHQPSMEDRVLSAATAAAAASALSPLAAIRKEKRCEPVVPFESGVTVEDLVRDMLRPMLREWLDANLPVIVERIVRDEVGRVVREAQDR
jgi:cell pole-organizing protein PopZ